MNSLSASSRKAGSALLTDDPAELSRIREPGVNLCVWQRTVSPELASFVDHVALPRTIKRISSLNFASLTPTSLNLEGLLQDIPATDGLALFRADIEHLARLYVELTGASRLNLKLESFAGNLCERFHVDCVQLRLICSYVGPGTEWLENAEVHRARLGPGAEGRRDEESGLLLPGAQVRQMPRFAVGLMKGECWPGNHGNGLVHRSPMSNGQNNRRVLFKIESEE